MGPITFCRKIVRAFGILATIIFFTAQSRVANSQPAPESIAIEWKSPIIESSIFYLRVTENSKRTINEQVVQDDKKVVIAARGAQFEIIDYATLKDKNEIAKRQVVHNNKTDQDYSIEYSSDRMPGLLLLFRPGKFNGYLVRSDNDVIDLLSLTLFGGPPPKAILERRDETIRMIPGQVKDEFGEWSAEIRKNEGLVNVYLKLVKKAGPNLIDEERQNTMLTSSAFWAEQFGGTGSLTSWEEEVAIQMQVAGIPSKVVSKLIVTSGNKSYSYIKTATINDLFWDPTVIAGKTDNLIVAIPNGYVANVVGKSTPMMWNDG